MYEKCEKQTYFWTGWSRRQNQSKLLFFFKKKLKQSKLPNTSSVKKKSNTDVSVHWFFMRIGFLWDEDSILQVRPTDRVL